MPHSKCLAHCVPGRPAVLTDCSRFPRDDIQQGWIYRSDPSSGAASLHIVSESTRSSTQPTCEILLFTPRCCEIEERSSEIRPTRGFQRPNDRLPSQHAGGWPSSTQISERSLLCLSARRLISASPWARGPHWPRRRRPQTSRLCTVAGSSGPLDMLRAALL